MRKRMTDLFEDIPVEILDAIVEKEGTEKKEPAGEKKKERREGIYLPKWAAAVLLVIFCSAVGAVGYAAVKYPQIFDIYWGSKETKFADELLLNEQYETENKDYRMRVEEILSDGEIKRILVSVEALNGKSWNRMTEENLRPIFSFNGSGGYSVSDYTGLMNEKNEWKKYYMFDGETEGNQCSIIYGIEHVNMYDIEWIQEHENEFVKLSFEIKDGTGNVYVISPDRNKFMQGVHIEKIVIRTMSVTVEGYMDDTVEENWKESLLETKSNMEIPCPTVIAQMEDGKMICLLEGNLRESEIETDESRGGANYSSTENFMGGRPLIFKAGNSFRRAFDTEQIAKIWVDGVEYQVK